MRTLFSQVAGLRVFTSPDTTTPVLATLPVGHQVTDLQPTTAPPAGWLEVEVTPTGAAAAVHGFMLDANLVLTAPVPVPPTPVPVPAPASAPVQSLWRFLPWIVAGIALIALGLLMLVMRSPAQSVDVQATAQAIVNATMRAQPPTSTPGVMIITATPPPATPTSPAPVSTATPLSTQAPAATSIGPIATAQPGDPALANQLSSMALPDAQKWLASNIGGKPEFWTYRGHNVWGYWDQGNSVQFRHWGKNTILTYWKGFAEPINTRGCWVQIPPKAGVWDGDTRTVQCPDAGATFNADGVGFHVIPNVP